MIDLISDHLHGVPGHILSVSVSDPVHCPVTGQVLVRVRVPVELHGCEQAPQAPQVAHTPRYQSKIQVKTETYDLVHPTVLSRRSFSLF